MSTFLISCGGTGGHLSPGIALAEALADRQHQAILLVSQKAIDTRLLQNYPALHFERIPGSPLSASPAAFARFISSQSRGFAASLRLLRDLHPDCVVGFGGFTTAAIILAARFRHLPIALHEANRVPGRAIRFTARFAHRLYLPPGVRLPGIRASRLRQVGLPVRREITRLPREEARLSLGLNPHQKVLVVFGGSQGASSLNDWARRQAPALAARSVQLYCVTGPGKGDASTVTHPGPGGHPISAHFTPFCDRVAALLSSADLVLARAGAGSLAEFTRCHSPALLVPYPHAADNHQAANAAYFERQGGGLVLPESSLHDLTDEVNDLLFNDDLLAKFRANLQRMDREHVTATILDDLEALASLPPRVPR